MNETVLLLLQGGIVMPISNVSAEYTPSNVVIYDGSTYRDDPKDVLGVATSLASVTDDIYTAMAAGINLYAGHAKAINQAAAASSTPAVYAADPITHTAPRYHGKQRTLWSFTRTVSAVAAFTHVIWGDWVIGTCSHAPWRVGMTPSLTIAAPA